jgi:hypothetical protein
MKFQLEARQNRVAVANTDLLDTTESTTATHDGDYATKK